MKLFKNKKIIRNISVVFAGTLLLTTAVNAASLTKKIDATYRNIKVFYNNQQKTMENEPFIYNNSVYLPVRAVGELVNKDIKWDSASNSVFVADKGGASGDLEAQLQSERFENARLAGQVSLLEKEVKELKEGKKDKEKVTGDIKVTLGYIEEFFDYEHSIDWDFALTETSSRINVDISFDSRVDGRRWDNLSKTQRENFFRDIAREIRVDFKDTTINGKVTDRRTDKTIGTFSYSKTNSFSYSDDSTTSFSALEKDLKKLITKIDGTNIPIDDIVITGNEDNITFTVYVDLYNRTLQNDWADTFQDKSRVIRGDMEYIQEEILRDYRHASVQGFIEDLDSGSTLAKYNGLRLY